MMTPKSEIGVLEVLALVALVLGAATYYSFRKKRGARVEDQQAERLRAEIARELAANLGVTTEEIAFSLDTLAAENQWAGSLSSLKIKCTFKKISPAVIHLVVNAYYARDGKPTMTTLERDISWDEVPREVRHDFIRSGEKELHYALGKGMQEAATQGGTL